MWQIPEGVVVPGERMAEKRRYTLAHFVFGGAVFGAMIVVTLGQQHLEGAESSSDMTMKLVAGGALLGSVLGVVVGRKKLSSD